MSKMIFTRRILFGAGAYLMAAASPAAAGAYGSSALSPSAESTIKSYYKAWEKNDWKPLDRLLAENFTFTSPNGDNHISKALFKSRCWDTQVKFISHFDLLTIYGGNDEAFVMYVCSTRNGNTFRNVEFLRLHDGSIESIECYFGANAGFPSAASDRHS